jgi:hypothetical protein
MWDRSICPDEVSSLIFSIDLLEHPFSGSFDLPREPLVEEISLQCSIAPEVLDLEFRGRTGLLVRLRFLPSVAVFRAMISSLRAAVTSLWWDFHAPCDGLR